MSKAGTSLNRDLTVGKPATVLRQFCLPLFASIIFQQLYNLADSFVAGKFIGEDALAAVGNSYEITLIFIAFAFGCNVGCSVVTARFFGAKSYRDVKTTVTTTFIATGVLCVVLMAAGLTFGSTLLKLIKTPTEILASSALYLDIYIWGLPFVFFYNVSTGIFSALGDSKTPFFFLAGSSLSNIGVDILFTTVCVDWFRSGVAGVAWATFICQGVSCLLAVIFVLRRLRGIRTQEKAPLFSWSILGDITKIALPSTLQQSFVSVGNIVIQSVVNAFGTGVIAGYAASIKLNNLVITSLVTLANGISNFTAQNLGAGKKERVPQGFAAGIRMVWVICIPLACLYFLFARSLVFFFLDEPSEAALCAGMQILRILSPCYVIIAAKIVTDGVLRGSGFMKPFMISTFTDLLLRVVLALFLSKTALGSTGIWTAWPIGWTIATALSIMFYRQKYKTQRKNDLPA